MENIYLAHIVSKPHAHINIDHYVQVEAEPEFIFAKAFSTLLVHYPNLSSFDIELHEHYLTGVVQ